MSVLPHAKGRSLFYAGVAKAFACLSRFSALLIPNARLLPKIIGQALENKRAEHKRGERIQQQQTEEQERDKDEARRIRLTKAYTSMPSEQQEILKQRARANLLMQGLKEEFLLGAIVQAEILRLVGEESEDAAG